MPTETRHICFDLEEVALALLDLRRRCGKPAPNGDIVDPVIEQDAASRNVRFTVQIIRQDGGTDKLVAGQAELGTALIYFCRQNKIPLPIRANKLVGIVNGALALICVRERKDFLPLDPPSPEALSAAAIDMSTVLHSPGPTYPEPAVDRAQQASLRLENARRRLREKAAS